MLAVLFQQSIFQNSIEEPGCCSVIEDIRWRYGLQFEIHFYAMPWPARILVLSSLRGKNVFYRWYPLPCRISAYPTLASFPFISADQLFYRSPAMLIELKADEFRFVPEYEAHEFADMFIILFHLIIFSSHIEQALRQIIDLICSGDFFFHFSGISPIP